MTGVLSRALGALGCAALLAGCVQAVDGSGRPAITGFPSSSSSPRPTPTASPAVAAPVFPRESAWSNYVDRPSGVHFDLPGKPKVDRRARELGDGTPAHETQYAVEFSSDLGVNVTIVRGDHEPLSVDLAAYPSELARPFRALGARDVRVLEKHLGRIDGFAAIRFRFTFRPETDAKDPPAWYVGAIAVHGMLVIVQAIYFPPPAGNPQLDQMRHLENRAISGLSLG